ncbi:MAG: glutamine synthetase [Alphaproteobacteria bacterium]|nr:glutamine synthetase [Alphaproteobacteria bacterium]
MPKSGPKSASRPAVKSESGAFFKENPDIEMLDVFLIDVNGIPRGKKLPAAHAAEFFKTGLRIPRSSFAVDIWGRDVLSAGIATQGGDNDGICHAVPGSLCRVPWLEDAPTAQVMLSMTEADGSDFFADPRQILKDILVLYKKKGLTPVMAAELEFHLLDGKPDAQGRPQPPRSPRTGRRSVTAQMFSLSELDEFGAVMNDIARACKVQGIPADTAVSENGPGQYEINLRHSPDALQAADHAVLMKRLVRGVVRNHGMDVAFMAKTYGDKDGNGMHLHFSVLDKKGENIFVGRTRKGSPALRHAIGGVLATMPDSTAVFAPNLNSYRRFTPGSHAPTRVSWGYDNRTAAVRVPESLRDATRIEHRVSGADTNPYLAMAAILAGALYGMEKKIEPPAPSGGSVYETDAERLPFTWERALEAFENSRFIQKYFGREYAKVYLACKRQERDRMLQQVTSIEYDAYLRDI